MSKSHQRLLAGWRQAADDLGLGMDEGFEVHLESGATVRSVLRVRNFGATNGMLIMTSYEPVEPLVDELVEAGYGFSVLSEPEENDCYVREEYIEILADWSWSGNSTSRPAWLPIDEDER